VTLLAYIVTTLWADTFNKSIRQEQFIILTISLIFRFQPKQPIIIQMLEHILSDSERQLKPR
jgi:hypothetical protein